jgi:peptidoglycan hydrolase-like protein with peptidoglycan-binding domain
LVIAAALLLAFLASPSIASAQEHHSQRTIDVVRHGTGYQSRDGSQRVRFIQRRLHRLGYAPGAIDGRYGPLTQAAVSRFQGAQHLTSDGEVGPLTYTRLVRSRPVLRQGAGYALPHGSRAVRSLQTRLRQSGYAPGPIDGRYGPLTRHAVLRFQADRGLAVDGVVGPQTSAHLAYRAPSARIAPKVTAPQLPAPPSAAPNASPPKRVAPPAGAQPARLPADVVRDVLVALGLLGLAVFLSSYARTRRRLARSGPAAGRSSARSASAAGRRSARSGPAVAGRLQERAR